MKKFYLLFMILLLVSCGKKNDVIVNNSQDVLIVDEYKEPIVEVKPSLIGRVIEIIDGDTFVEVISSNDGYFKNDDIVNIGDTGDALYLSGTNVKITYNSFIKETYPAQIEPISIDVLNSQIGYVKLEDLSEDYSEKDAVNDGCFVMKQDESYNISVLMNFIDDVESGASSFIRIAQFTTEGDMILTDVKYIKRDNKFYVRVDSIRDKFADINNKKIKELEYTKYRKEKNESETGIFLDNAEGTILVAAYNTDKFIENKVDRLLTVITNSPKISSSPADYIEAHQEAYNELIDIDTDALKVMFNRLANKDSGLKEMIELSACRKILGKEDIKMDADTPYEWYSEYKAYILKTYDRNSKEFMEKNMPKASKLLDFVQK